MNTKPDDARSTRDVIHLDAANRDVQISARVRDLPTRIKRILTTDEGKLQVLLEAEGLDDDALAQVKDMLVLQQSALVRVSMTPAQGDLFAS